MQLKCPGCSRALKIPDSAAGKVVKCPCGKQLRVPGGQPSAAGPSAAASPQRPSQPSPRSSRPQANRPAAPQPSATGGGFGGVDDGMFDELTDSDMGPVNVPKVAGAGLAAASNPYAGPEATKQATATASTDLAGPLATVWRRLANLILDTIFSIILFFTLAPVAIIVMSPAMGGAEAPAGPAEPAASTLILVIQVAIYAFFIMYYLICESLFAATPAKFITGTRVVTVDGGKASFGKILIRSLARIIPFEPLSFFMGGEATGWHDTMSGTRVINIRA